MSKTNGSCDWRTQFSVRERWGEARKRDLFTDVNFTVGVGGSARSFSAHKNVLAFCSPVFEAMFYGALPETQDSIPIVDIGPEAFEAFLGFAYGEKISFPSVSYAAKLYVVADKYLISDLLIMIEEFIYETLMDDRQFWEVIQQDELFLNPLVRKKCLQHISQNAVTLFKSDLFPRVSDIVILEILHMKSILITEYGLLSAVVRWGIGNKQPGETLRTTLDPFLGHIRFTNLKGEEFCKFLDNHPDLLNPADSIAIMKHLHNRSIYKLPAWCSKSTTKRHQATHGYYCRCTKCM